MIEEFGKLLDEKGADESFKTDLEENFLLVYFGAARCEQGVVQVEYWFCS